MFVSKRSRAERTRTPKINFIVIFLYIRKDTRNTCIKFQTARLYNPGKKEILKETPSIQTVKALNLECSEIRFINSRKVQRPRLLFSRAKVACTQFLYRY